MTKLVLTFFCCFIFSFQGIIPTFVAGQNVDAAVNFQPEHGFFDQPIQITLTTELDNTAIHYTLDGSEPATVIYSSTLLYQAPLVIEKTCCVRAAAILTDGSKSEIVTRTFIFPNDIILQDYQATLNAGLPAKWGRFTPDYGMDPDIVNDAHYRNLVTDALLSLPSMSIVMNIDDLFGANGIYSNSEQTGAEWERPGSVELFFPDKTEGFQVNCGIRMQGGWFRQDAGTKKHSFRLLFKSQYGPSKLRYPLFGENAEDRFDTIVLRGGANDGYSWSDARYTEQYTRDEFGRRLHKYMGNVSPHGMFVHLYLNGIYWGLYNPIERPDDSFSAIYHGGDKSNWDAINSGQLDEGSMDAWNLLLSKCRSGVSSLEAYMEILGNNPDGTRNPDFPILLDVQNYIDYMIVNMWGGNWDWPWKNYRITRDRTDASTGFQFFIWDYENVMGNNRGRSPLDMDRVAGLASMGAGVGEPHIHLIKNGNYRMLFADRVQKHFFNGGPFSPDFLIDLYRELASEVELAIVAESARWGDQHYSTDPLTQNDWFVERDWILNTYLAQRSDIVLDQFRTARLYPQLDAPVYQVNGAVQYGGYVTPTDLISINATEGTIYYTLNGSDPRLSSNSGNNNFVIVPEDVQKNVLVPQSAISLIWRSAPGLDITNWHLCQGKPGGVGYERNSGYENYISLDVEDEMYSKNNSCYIRIPFNLSAGVADSLVFFNLRMRYDDGFIAWLNGMEVARKNFTGNPQWNSSATSQNSDDGAVIFEDIDISQHISKLK
ncbi:CotH kinase family protein, partial [candidate division KSB1 bacterium]|nr:CotH kinase family protein [candidate division KSB1 bacterium]